MMREELRKISFPDWQADGLIEDYAQYARGEADEITSDVLTGNGQPPRPFTRFAQDYAPAFR